MNARPSRYSRPPRCAGPRSRRGRTPPANAKPAACCSRPRKSKFRGVVSRGHRGVEEQALAHVDPTEELPVALQLRVRARDRWCARESASDLRAARASEARPAPSAGRSPRRRGRCPVCSRTDRAGAVAADHVVGLQDLSPRTASHRRRRSRARRCRPARPCCAVRPNRHVTLGSCASASAQHLLRQVLRQALVPGSSTSGRPRGPRGAYQYSLIRLP